MEPEIGTVSAASPASTFDRVARFYDLTYTDFEDDLPLYRGFAERCGSPILEVGCGTGRVVVPLAQAGFQVVGVDSSPAMLAIARQKAEQAGVTERVACRQTDVRRLELEQRFPLAIVASNTFGLFTAHSDQVQLLRSVRRVLRPKGLLIIDVFNPDLNLLAAEDGQLFHDFTRVDPTTGRTVVKMHSRRVNLAQQLIDATFIYDEIEPDGTVRRTLFPFATRYFFLAEIEMLLEQSGYGVEAVYGSYDLDAYCSESDRMVFVASPTTRKARA